MTPLAGVLTTLGLDRRRIPLHRGLIKDLLGFESVDSWRPYFGSSEASMSTYVLVHGAWHGRTVTLRLVQNPEERSETLLWFVRDGPARRPRPAQCGDHFNGIHEVTGSIPVSSTNSDNNLEEWPIR